MTDTNYCHLDSLGVLACSGPDNAKFLQGQLTCDLNKITTDNTLPGAYCNAQGRMIAAFHISLHQQSYYLLMPKDNVEHCLSQLKKFALFSKVKLENLNESHLVYGLCGPSSPSMIEKIKSMNAEIKIVSLPGQQPRYAIISPITYQQTIKSLLDASAQISPSEQWHLHDIEMGMANVYHATSEQFIPQRVNFHLIDGISFAKGCYVGQEIIARLHHRGKLKHHMYRLQLKTNQTPPPGASITHPSSTKVIGTIVDSCQTSANICQALALLAITAAEENTFIIGDSDPIAVKHLTLPYQLTEPT